jgi:hypothetical protein
MQNAGMPLPERYLQVREYNGALPDFNYFAHLVAKKTTSPHGGFRLTY